MHLTGNLLNQQELSSRKVTPAQVFEQPSNTVEKQMEALQPVKLDGLHGGDDGLETRDFFRDGMEESRN